MGTIGPTFFQDNFNKNQRGRLDYALKRRGCNCIFDLNVNGMRYPIPIKSFFSAKKEMKSDFTCGSDLI